MRAAEICRLQHEDVDIEAGTAFVKKSKNGTSRYAVLTDKAISILAMLPKLDDDDRVFLINPASLDTQFRNIRAKTPIEGLVFHDSRHEAVTRLARKLEPLELARVIGHTNLNELLTYYNESPATISAKLRKSKAV